jgi:hypothetical protein
MILLLVEPAGESEDLSPLRAFVNDTIHFQQFSNSYGQSQFSFWGQYPNIAKWGKPIAGVLYLLFCMLTGLLPGQMNIRRLLVMTTAILIATQFTLSHGGGTYIGFYIAPLIITLFGPSDYSQPETIQISS